MKHVPLSLLFAIGLTACTVAPAENFSGAIAAAVTPSASIKAQIVADARTFLADPYSVRDAGISNVATFSDGTQGICVRANARNAMGGYSGRQNLAITIRNGVLTGNILNHPLCARPDLTWNAFPELEALREI